MRQASNMMAAIAFADEIGAPLKAHATIHWSGTYHGDDPEGRHFAKVREGFDKWLLRSGVSEGLTAIWVRERLSGGTADVEHCHMLFHLPPAFHQRKKQTQVLTALQRLVERHGGGMYGDFAVDVRLHSNPDGLYLIKGGGRDVWLKFRIKKELRKPQGRIVGKRCGVTENIGPAARKRCGESRERINKEAA